MVDLTDFWHFPHDLRYRDYDLPPLMWHVLNAFLRLTVALLDHGLELGVEVKHLLLVNLVDDLLSLTHE